MKRRDFPRDLLIIICEYFQRPQDFYSFILICSRFARLFSTPTSPPLSLSFPSVGFYSTPSLSSASSSYKSYREVYLEQYPLPEPPCTVLVPLDRSPPLILYPHTDKTKLSDALPIHDRFTPPLISHPLAPSSPHEKIRFGFRRRRIRMDNQIVVIYSVFTDGRKDGIEETYRYEFKLGNFDVWMLIQHLNAIKKINTRIKQSSSVSSYISSFFPMKEPLAQNEVEEEYPGQFDEVISQYTTEFVVITRQFCGHKLLMDKSNLFKGQLGQKISEISWHGGRKHGEELIMDTQMLNGAIKYQIKSINIYENGDLREAWSLYRGYLNRISQHKNGKLHGSELNYFSQRLTLIFKCKMTASTYQNGKLSGEAWYWPPLNNDTHIPELTMSNYKNGSKDGFEVECSRFGKMIVSYLSDGKRNGDYCEWYNQNLVYCVTMKTGKKHGEEIRIDRTNKDHIVKYTRNWKEGEPEQEEAQTIFEDKEELERELTTEQR